MSRSVLRMPWSCCAHFMFPFSYFNTVGSKEGWAPSQFRSSRDSRHEAEVGRVQHRPQDFMDEEDLADATNSQKLDTSQSFMGVGNHHDDALSSDRFMGLLHVKSETAGVLLLKRMGWRSGQGIGPKVHRKPRLGGNGASTEERPGAIANSFLFAPDDIAMVQFSNKADRSGLGLYSSGNSADQHPGKTAANDRKESSRVQGLSGTYPTSRASHGPSSGRGFGVGVLNDSSSGEDDPYEIGPKITRIRRVRNPKKTKGLTKGQATVQASSSSNMRDEHNALAGFTRGMTEDAEAVMFSQLQNSFPVPEWWTPSRRAAAGSTAQTAQTQPRASSPRTLSSAVRGRILGEPEPSNHTGINSVSEPGSITGRSSKATNSPSSQAAQPTRQAAKAALEREQEGRGPYRTQPSKQERYRRYLEYHAGLNPLAPTKRDGMGDQDFNHELAEFYNCVGIFKPMAGPMASRFTAATASTPSTKSVATADPRRDQDTPREAARLGMFGNMTRSVVDFTPSSLLCKRFNVAPPRANDSAGGDRYPQGLGAVVPQIDDVKGEALTTKHQDRPVAKDRETLTAMAPSGGANTAQAPARNKHVSEEVFDSIFGD